MTERDDSREQELFELFREYFDLEKDANAQHDQANYSLARMEPLAALAGHPEGKVRIVHIAGTKGKGSTCYFIAALLQSAGYRCGIFTSPHVLTVRERFQLDGELISYSTLLSAAREFRDRIHAAGLKPSLFEIFTVLALKIFAEAGMDFAIMETGIGGRLDATNYVTGKLLSVITPVSFDHMALLGKDIASIATEKAGIIEAGRPVVLAKQPFAEAAAVIAEVAARRGAHLVSVEAVSPDLSGWNLPRTLPPFELDNFRTALTALDELRKSGCLERGPVSAAFQMPRLRGRFEVLRGEPPVIVDAAHNGDSARRLAEAVNCIYPGREFVCVLGCLAGKDVHRIVCELSRMNARFILTNPRTPRKSALDEVKAECIAEKVDVMDVVESITDCGQLPQDRPLIFTGSFFTAVIGEELFLK